MSKQSKSKPSKSIELKAFSDGVKKYWQHQLQTLGRSVFFIDTGAILPALNPDDTQIRPFIEDQIVKDHLITSTYVIHESVRRILKPTVPRQFKGPSGLFGPELALHFIRDWLARYDVIELCIPEEVFDSVKSTYEANRHLACDMTDICSFVIVKGMEQDHIISPDNHFRRLGLNLLP